MKRNAVLAILALGAVAAAARAAGPEEEVNAAFERFIAAQNAHDLKAVEAVLVDAPDFLWVARGVAIFGRAAALKKFETLYQGTWQLDPDRNALRIWLISDTVAELFVPITFTIGPPLQKGQQTLFLMNQVVVKKGGAWRIRSILPIPLPAATQ